MEVPRANISHPSFGVGGPEVDMSDSPIYPHSKKEGEASYLLCTMCGKQVSSAFHPLSNELGFRIVVRAIIVCPECLEAKITFKGEEAPVCPLLSDDEEASNPYVSPSCGTKFDAYRSMHNHELKHEELQKKSQRNEEGT